MDAVQVEIAIKELSGKPTLKNFTGQFRVFAQCPGGINKLRGLVLRLAVMGKLVNQLPNEESASTIIQKLKNEKERLIKNLGLKNQKPVKPIDNNDKFCELPFNWEWVKLDEIGISSIGLTYSPKDISDTGIPVLRSSNIQNGRIDLIDLVRLDKVVKDSLHLRKGDLLICARNGSRALVGKTAMIKELVEPMTFGAFMAIYKSRCNSYIEVFLNSPVFRDLLGGVSTTTINQITQSKIKNTVVPLPPLEEQKRIVAKVNELMALCDQLEAQQQQQANTLLKANAAAIQVLLTNSDNKENLTKNWQRLANNFHTLYANTLPMPPGEGRRKKHLVGLENIKQLRKTILYLAVTGKLTESIASEGNGVDLKEKISVIRDKLLKEKKIKGLKVDSDLSKKYISKILPKHWEWALLGELITKMDAGWSPACDSEPAIMGNWGVLKTTAVQTMEYREYENKNLPSKLEPKINYEVHNGDILFTRAGPKQRVGICCLVEKTQPKLMISDKIIRIHLVDGMLNEKFISLTLNAGISRNYIESQKSGMAESQMNISQPKLRATPIPLPPLEEQKRIVEKVDQLMMLCDQLEKQFITAYIDSNKLLNATIKSLVA